MSQGTLFVLRKKMSRGTTPSTKSNQVNSVEIVLDYTKMGKFFQLRKFSHKKCNNNFVIYEIITIFVL